MSRRVKPPHLFGSASHEPRPVVRRTQKLTPEAVLLIRTCARAGVSQAALARRHGVSASTIRAVVLRRIWKDA